jgi:Cu-Zn family superoxide dismutase
MRRTWLAAGVAVAAAGGVATLATAAAEEPRAGAAQAGRTANATLRGLDGRLVGRVRLEAAPGGTLVTVRVRGGAKLPAGFHGLHVHAAGRCEPPFTSAGGHAAAPGQPHGEHVGDLPSLLVTGAGTALMSTVTDRFVPADLLDTDGSAVMVHAAADNFANIPDRYRTPDGQSGPDEETERTGDSGGRIACGVLR